MCVCVFVSFCFAGDTNNKKAEPAKTTPLPPSSTASQEIWLLQRMFAHMLSTTLWRLEADMPKCGAALSIAHPDGTAHTLTIQTICSPEGGIVGADVLVEFHEQGRVHGTSHAQKLARRRKGRTSASVMRKLLGDAMVEVQASIENAFKVRG